MPPNQEAMVVELQDEKRKLKRELRNARRGGLPASAYIVQMWILHISSTPT